VSASAGGDAPSLDGRRFAADGIVYELREHDGIVWADLWGADLAHGHLVGRRERDRVVYTCVAVNRDRTLRTWNDEGDVERGPDERVRLHGARAALAEVASAGTVLFLCTGNFYRSRFAEQLFEHLGHERGLDWRAKSRGLRAWVNGPLGVISEETVRTLAARGVTVSASALRPPALASRSDIESATRIIALDEDEHRPMVETYLHEQAARVEFWSVPDRDKLDPDDALARIAANVAALVEELAAAPTDASAPDVR
jgi:protein-tyrosine phosphatase